MKPELNGSLGFSGCNLVSNLNTMKICRISSCAGGVVEVLFS